MLSPLLKLPFLLVNVLMAYNVSVAPSKGRMSSTSSWFDWTHGMMVVWSYRIVTISFPFAELIAIIYTSLETKTTKTNLSPTMAFVVLSLLNILGAAYRRHCMNVLGDQFTFKVGIREEHKLVTRGPYSIVRHPSYTSGLVVYYTSVMGQLIPGSWMTEYTLVGTDVWLGKAIVFVLASLVLLPSLVARMNLEDRMLKATFGGEWEKYRHAVPSKLFPGIY